MIFKKQLALFLTAGLALVAIGATAAAVRAHPTPQIALYFLNVGQGDSELIQLASGAKILIDGGPDGKKLLDNLAAVLPPQDRYIDLLIMTHPQLDHMNGFIDVLKSYQVGAFIGNLRKGSIAAYDELHHQIEQHNIPYIQLMAGDKIKIGDTALHILSPTRGDILSKELNDTSEVLLLDSPQITALYTGDIGSNVEQELATRYGKKLNVDVLKVGHHGSRFSSGTAFLRATTPAVAVIEVGKNTYGHPTQQALARLAASGAKILRTDKNGIVKVVPAAGVVEIFHNQE